MALIKRLVCRLIGHRIDADEPMRIQRCTRCTYWRGICR